MSFILIKIHNQGDKMLIKYIKNVHNHFFYKFIYFKIISPNEQSVVYI